MIKLTFCLKRAPHLSLEQFQDYWLNKHGPLVLSVKDVLRIRQYVQSHALSPDLSAAMRRSRGCAADGFDGVAQLWWDSLDDLAAISADPEAKKAQRALIEDEKTFIDLANSPAWFGEDHPIVIDGQAVFKA